MTPIEIEDTALAAIKPWSHTDRRMMVTLIDMAPDTPEGRKDIESVLEEVGEGALMVRLAAFKDWDADDRDEISSPPRFFVTSWSKRAPKRLRLRSRPRVNLFSTQDWAYCGVELKQHEICLTMEVLAEGEFSLSP